MKTRILVIIGIIFAIGILVMVISQVDLYDYNKYRTVFGDRTPLAELGTGKPVLSKDNCDRYAYWLTEHQKDKITLIEDFSVRYPPWGNQIFPLVEYCTTIGELTKISNGDSIQWFFQEH